MDCGDLPSQCSPKSSPERRKSVEGTQKRSRSLQECSGAHQDTGFNTKHDHLRFRFQNFFFFNYELAEESGAGFAVRECVYEEAGASGAATCLAGGALVLLPSLPCVDSAEIDIEHGAGTYTCEELVGVRRRLPCCFRTPGISGRASGGFCWLPGWATCCMLQYWCLAVCCCAVLR